MPSPVIDIPWDVEAVFQARPNRFIGMVDIPELGLSQEKVHVHDPGRLKELLYHHPIPICFP